MLLSLVLLHYSKLTTILMKAFLSLSVSLLFCLSLNAQEGRDLNLQVDSLSRELSATKQVLSEVSAANNSLKQRVGSLEAAIRIINGQSEEIEARVATTERGVAENVTSLQDAKDGFASQIQATDEKITGQETNLKNKTMWGIIIALVVLAISALLSLLLNKKGNAKIEALQGKAEKLNEEIVNKMSTEVSEIQKITASIGSLPAAGASSQSEQDLIKALADRITFMEMTLYKMDPGVKGFKHLTKSISQMKDNLRANGYELIDMLGKEYSEGMKATVSFDDDDTLPEGTRIITKIIKPQINYNGVMIQSAQITVSQNI